MDVLYSSADTEHFVERLAHTDDNAHIFPDSSFDRSRDTMTACLP